MDGSLKYKIKPKEPDTKKSIYYMILFIKSSKQTKLNHCLGIYTWGKTINKSKEVNIIKVEIVTTEMEEIWTEKGMLEFF